MHNVLRSILVLAVLAGCDDDPPRDPHAMSVEWCAARADAGVSCGIDEDADGWVECPCPEPR